MNDSIPCELFLARYYELNQSEHELDQLVEVFRSSWEAYRRHLEENRHSLTNGVISFVDAFILGRNLPQPLMHDASITFVGVFADDRLATCVKVLIRCANGAIAQVTYREVCGLSVSKVLAEIVDGSATVDGSELVVSGTGLLHQEAYLFGGRAAITFRGLDWELIGA